MKELNKYAAYAKVALGASSLMTFFLVSIIHCNSSSSFNWEHFFVAAFFVFTIFWIFYSLLAYLQAYFSKPHLQIEAIRQVLEQEGFRFFQDQYLEGYIQDYYCIVYCEPYQWWINFEICLTPNVDYNFKKMRQLLKDKAIEIDKTERKVILSQPLGTIYQSLNNLTSDLTEITLLIHQSQRL